MADYVSFFVPGEPVGKGRPRFVRATGRTYTPAKTAQAEGNIRACAALAMAGAPLIDRPVELRVVAYHLPPKSRSKKAAAHPWAGFKGTRPDTDNYVKAVMDALNGVVLVDDGLVAGLHAAKVYGDRPGLQVTVQPIDFVSWPFLGGVVA